MSLFRLVSPLLFNLFYDFFCMYLTSAIKKPNTRNPPGARMKSSIPSLPPIRLWPKMEPAPSSSRTKPSSTEFELISFRNTSRVHIHRGVTTIFGKPVILLILIRRVGCLCKQRSAGYGKSKSGRLDETSTQHHLLLYLISVRMNSIRRF